MQIVSKSFVDELGNLYFDVSYYDSDGTVIEKRIPAEQYITLLENNCAVKETFIKVPKLPEEVLACKVSTENAASFDAVVFMKASKRAFCFCGQHFLVPFPALIAHVVVRDGVKREMKLFALATDEPTDETPLLQYPFGNVGDTGGCCFGNIVVKNITSVEKAVDVLDAFLCGETNGDLYRSQNSEKLSQGKLVEGLVGKEVFPVELLVGVRSGLTVGKLLSL